MPSDNLNYIEQAQSSPRYGTPPVSVGEGTNYVEYGCTVKHVDDTHLLATLRGGRIHRFSAGPPERWYVVDVDPRRDVQLEANATNEIYVVINGAATAKPTADVVVSTSGAPDALSLHVATIDTTSSPASVSDGMNRSPEMGTATNPNEEGWFTRFSLDGLSRTLFDARQRYKHNGSHLNDAGYLVDPFEDLSTNWSADNAATTLQASTDTVYRGTQSAQVTSTSSDKGALLLSLPNGVDLSQRDISIAVKIVSPSDGLYNFEVGTIYSGGFGALTHRRLHHSGIQGEGWYRFDLGPSIESGTFDAAQVDDITVNYTDGGQTSEFYVDDLRFPPKAEQPLFCPIFDDARESAYTVAFPEMEARGLVGSVAVIPELIGESGHLTMEQLSEMYQAGWEVIGHSLDDFNGSLTTESERRSEFERVKNWLIDHGFERGSRFWVWPMGRYDRDAVDLASEYFYMAFNNDGGQRGLSPLNLTDPLIANRVGSNTLSDMQALQQLAVDYNQVHCQTFHRVDQGEYISLADFTTFLDDVVTSEMQCITPSDWWESISTV